MRPIIICARDRAQIPLLLGTQTLFNLRFYAVVPFLALVLTEQFHLVAAGVGLVLGIRTFAQQGMFLVGGTLSDLWGPKRTILVGIAIRTLGFTLLAASVAGERAPLWLFLAGTVFAGLGGALFSPGLNVLVAAAEEGRARARVGLFAWLTITGELGAVLGPVVGSALLGHGFGIVAASGAAYFAAIGILLAVVLPGSHTPSALRPPPTAPGARWTAAIRDRRFTAFAALNSVDLLAYNQLYLGIPLVLAGSPNPGAAVAAVFVLMSVLTLGTQLPLARWSRLRGESIGLRTGYSCEVAGFVLLALASGAEGSLRLPLAAVAATGFGVGHLLVNPTALQLVPALARRAHAAPTTACSPPSVGAPSWWETCSSVRGPMPPVAP